MSILSNKEMHEIIGPQMQISIYQHMKERPGEKWGQSLGET